MMPSSLTGIVGEVNTERPPSERHVAGGPTVWVLTDARYLAQRMPSALFRWLRSHQVPTRLVVAERVLLQLGPPPDALPRDRFEPGRAGSRADPWSDLRPGDVVVGRTRNPFA